MFNSDMLEVAIGLVFVYLLFSFLATALREGMEAWLKQRGEMLERGLLGLFTEPVGQATSPAPGARLTAPQAAARAEAVLERFYRSAPIYGLFRGGYAPPSQRGRDAPSGARAVTRKLPSYIPQANFAMGVLAVVESYANPGAGGAPGSLDRLRLALEGVPNAQVRNVVRAGIRLSGGDPERLRQYLEAWFDGAMDRVSGQYRRHTQVWVLLGSLVVAVALNVNTISIVQGLSENSAMRKAIADNAGLVADDKTLTDSQAKLDRQIASVRQAGLPIGWDAPVRDELGRLALQGPELPRSKDGTAAKVVPLGALLVALGWLMTALAISLGAPFWFDILNKFMVVRATVKPSEKSGEEASKDAAPTPEAAAPATAAAPARSVPAAPASASSISEDDRLEFGSLDPAERPREDDWA
jgi:hypothetical protein